jgi:hypothetical protein
MTRALSLNQLGIVTLVCRYCGRPMTRRGPFWADDSQQIYCQNAGGQHVPVPKKPESP